MSSRIIVPPKLVGEAPVVQLDFASDIAGTATLLSASTSISVFSGVDSNPTALLAGTAVEAGTTRATAAFSTGGVAGTIYDVEVTAIDTDSNRWTIGFYLAVTAKPN